MRASRIPIIGRFLKKPSVKYRTYRGIESVRTRTNLFYYPIRALFRTVARTQHSEIRAIGLENLPGDGSVLLVGNHPNSLLDFFNLLVVVRHPIATIVKETITAVPIIGPIVRNFALMVPVARRIDADDSGIDSSERRKLNDASFQEAVDLLVQGRLFNIYAEGRSTDARRLNKIKLGFMQMAIQAEREFDFKLNLRIVPFGYFYDRINKFQSAVCLVFGKPFKLRSLIDLPDDYLNLSEAEQTTVERKLMVEGKARLQASIESMIISISDPGLIDLVDEVTSIYTSTPAKYMGSFGNIREKYRMSRWIAEAVQKANQNAEGKARLKNLRRLVGDYTTRLREMAVQDRLIRREHSIASIGYHLKWLILGIAAFPLIAYGFFANYIPRTAGRIRRYWVIHVQKRPRVDGDEQTILAAFAAVLITYPIFWALIYWGFHERLLFDVAAFLRRDWQLPALARHLTAHTGLWSAGLATAAVYLMGRLWRFSLVNGRHLRNALTWIVEGFLEIILGRKIRELRDLRYEITDAVDFLIGDYNDS